MGKPTYLSFGLGVLVVVLIAFGLKRSLAGGSAPEVTREPATVATTPPEAIEQKPAPPRPPGNSPTKFYRAQPRYCTLHIALLMEGGNPLGLSPWQLDSIQSAYNQAYAEKEKMDRTMATVEVLSPTEHFLRIPAYPEKAGEILDHFYASIVQLLGPALGAEFRSRYAKDIEGMNNGFGRIAREILVDVMPDPTYFRIVETIRITHADGSEIPVTGISNLKSDSLVQYEHLKPLFPFIKTRSPSDRR